MASHFESYAFYTVCNAKYFTGALALVNSLRLTGHSGPLNVLDIDLLPEQRARLEPQATLIRADSQPGINPLLLKGYPESLGATGVIVMIDSDIIVTGNLMPIIELAREGKICAYADADQGRWFAEWETLFSVGPLRHQVYVNSGFVAFSADRWPHLLRRCRELSEAIPTGATRAGGARKGTPLWDGDQDALNALLMSEIPADALHLLPRDEAPGHPRDRVFIRIEDAQGLVCTCRGTRTRMLHATGAPKPWQARRSAVSPRDGFANLLPRVLFADDLVLRASPAELPLGYRPGFAPRAFATADRVVVSISKRLRRRMPSA